MKVSRAALLAAAMVSTAVFAQDDEAESTEVRSISTRTESVSRPAPAVATAAALPAVAAEEKSGPKLRVSGDFYLNPAFEMENDWWYEESTNGFGLIVKPKIEDKENAFNVLYNWNVALGVDFGDNFSLDFRLSNRSGYECDYLSFNNGSARGLLPYLPNAYFTWKPGSVFSLSGGLLEVTDNTVLNFVAGTEEIYYSDFEGGGLYSFYSNWATIYNNSQGGLKFGFDFSDNFSLNLTAALVSPTNTLDYTDDNPYDYVHNEFRFILDANIALGDVVTLSPVVQTRSFWREGSYTSGNYNNPKTERRTPILLAYGADLGLAFNDVFTLDVGFAAGNVRLGKERTKGGDYKYDADETASGFLVKVAPSLAFGINEVGLGYSLGVGNYTDSGKLTYKGDKASEKYKSTMLYNDIWFSWLFRVNDYFAFGPSASLISQTDKYSIKYKSDIPDYEVPDDVKETTGGYNWQRFGIDFVVSF